MDDTEVSNSYDVLKQNAEELLQLVNKYVKVRLIKETEFNGYVHSIDPFQHSVILLTPAEDSHTVNIIPGHAILDMVEILPIPNLKVPSRKVATLNSASDIVKQKEKLMSWFNKNLLQTTESEEKILFGNVSILPPYDVSSICTDNPVVAMQVRKIIENMPQDFDPGK